VAFRIVGTPLSCTMVNRKVYALVPWGLPDSGTYYVDVHMEWYIDPRGCKCGME
jgi:hypothetical protein